jgi:hypothetical protein
VPRGRHHGEAPAQSDAFAGLFSVCIDRFLGAQPQTLKTVVTMKNRQHLRNFAGRAYYLSLVAALAACSGAEVEPDGAAGTSSGGTGNNSGASSTSGAGKGGAASSGGSSSGSGTTGSDELIGSFQVQVVADDEDPTTGSTSVIGKVNDRPTPSAVIWDVATEDGDCRLEKPRVPFCDGGCGAEVCVDDGVCQPYATGHSVGEVKLSGLMVMGGASELVLKEIAKSYQPPAGTVFAYPPFAEGDAVAVHAAGGDYAGFDLSAKGVVPVTFSSSDFELDEGKALELTWNGATDPKSSQVHIKLDISHHGGSRGQISCDADDTGSLTISAALMTELISLGVAGFPSVILTRVSSGSAKIEVGRVELAVSSKTERIVTVAGYASCTEDTDCPDGEVCQADLTCM